MKDIKTLAELKRELRKVDSSFTGTDRVMVQTFPLLVKEIQLIRKSLSDILDLTKSLVPPKEIENGTTPLDSQS